MKLTLLFMALSIGPADDKAGNDQNIPLGPLGGWVRVRHGESDAEVTAVKQESPAARAGLLVGDRVFSAGGEDFPIHTKNIDAGGAGPEEELGNAIERAESGERGELTLGVRRGEEEMELAVRIPLLGAYAEGFPAGCVKSRSFQDGICAQLVASQQADGRWRATTGISADRYTTALCGIALLGRGDPEHLDALGAITHVDGTARVQTVTKEQNAGYLALIRELGKRRGTECVLNTSFNIRGEPIVQTPDDALKCFWTTGMDDLYLGPFHVEKVG